MLQKILQDPNLIFYILAAEVFVLGFLQLRNNMLLRRSLKLRKQKKEKVQQIKEEVKMGTSEIPVVKFERQTKKPVEEKKIQKKGGYDAKEMAVLQEMMSEFFG